MISEQSARPVKRLKLLGIPIDSIDPDFLDEQLVDLLHKDGNHQVIFLRTLDLLRARRNPEFRACLENAALVVPVSKGLQLACNRLHLGLLPRYSPFDFMIKLLNVLEAKHASFYLLGDMQPYLNRTETNLRHTFPGAQPLGRYTGSFSRAVEQNIRIAVSKASPNLLLAGPGLKGKDLWIYRRRSSFPRGVQVWCAECFYYFTARKKRPNRVSFRKGRDYYRESIGKPWRWFRFPLYVYFQFLVQAERIRHPRPAGHQAEQA